MVKTGCFSLLVFVICAILLACSQVTDTYVLYDDTSFPPLAQSKQNLLLNAISEESVPLAPEPIVVTQPTTTQTPSISTLTNPVTPSAPEEYITFTLEGLHDEVLLQESPDAGQEYVDGTCYIGDSITLGLKVFKILPEERVFSAGSIDPYAAAHNKMVTLPDGRQVTAPQAVGYYKPQRVVITLGTNSVSWTTEKAFISTYAQLIDDIRAESPSTVVIIQSIPPVSEAYEANAIKLTNKTVNHFNKLLLEMAAEKSVYFLNTASVLKNERGYFNDIYQSGDGLHHNQACYSVWLDYLRTHAVPTV